MANQEKESRIRRDVNGEGKGVDYRERPSFLFQQRRPISDVNLTEQVGQRMGDVGMRELQRNDEQGVQMR